MNRSGIDYIVADPTGNITVLITSPYTGSNRSVMIRRAFELEPDCEQVGFIVHSEAGYTGLEMMGYEFCGNASLSAAAWQAFSDGLGIGEEAVIRLDSSGSDDELEVSITRIEDRVITDAVSGSSAGMPQFIGKILMPRPAVDSYKGYPAIHLPGISHLIVPSSDFTDDQATDAIREFTEDIGVPALGMMFVDEDGCSQTEDASVYSISIRPLVYVKDSDTVVWEHGCASGSTAAGYFICTGMNGTRDDDACKAAIIKQPGGTMSVRIIDGRPELTGKVILKKY